MRRSRFGDAAFWVIDAGKARFLLKIGEVMI